jgi:chromosome partitioning protein
MITISVANQKGGEGKTTTSINLAEGLSRRGFKTILLDIDPQGNSSSIYSNPDELDLTMFHLFHRRLKLQEILTPTKKPNLYLAPSNIKLAEMEILSSNTVEAPFMLRDSMENLNDFEFCIIDCPPSLSVFTINALVASQYVLIPLQAEKFSIDGITGLQQTITSIKKRINPNLEIIGALVTQLKQHTILTKTIIPVLDKYFKVFETTISDGVAIGESHLARCSIYDYNGKSRQAKEYESFIEEILHELKD